MLFHWLFKKGLDNFQKQSKAKTKVKINKVHHTIKLLDIDKNKGFIKKCYNDKNQKNG